MNRARTLAVKPRSSLSLTRPWAYYSLAEGFSDSAAASCANDSRATPLPPMAITGAGTGYGWKRGVFQAGTNVTGVTVIYADNGCPTGNGTITFAISGTTLTWTPAGGTAGAAVDIHTAGHYRLEGGGATTKGIVIYSAGTGTIPAGNQSDANIAVPTVLTHWAGNGFPGGAGDRQIEMLRADNTAAYDSVFAIGQNHAMFWCQIAGGMEVSDKWFEIGGSYSGDTKNRLYLEASSSVEPRVGISDKTGVSAKTAVSGYGPINGAQLTMIGLIDRSAQTISLYYATPGSAAVVGSGTGISALGDLLVPHASDLLTGVRFNCPLTTSGVGYQTSQAGYGAIRRFGFVNLGATMPSNIADVIQSLARSQGIPTRELGTL